MNNSEKTFCKTSIIPKNNTNGDEDKLIFAGMQKSDFLWSNGIKSTSKHLVGCRTAKNHKQVLAE